jgi:NitT/TauT family transport system permease protein
VSAVRLPERSQAPVDEVEEPGGSRLRRRPELVLVPGIFVLVLLAWQLLSDALSIPEILLPRPLSVLRSLVSSLSGPFWGPSSVYYHFASTAWVAVAGFAIGSALAVVVAVLVTQWRLVDATMTPYITAFQALPRIAVAPLIVIWFGQTVSTKIIIAATITFFPVLVAAISGLRSVDPDMLSMLRGFSASRWKLLTKVQFPTALPYIFAGLRVAAVFSVVAAIVAEWVGSNSGLGVLLLQAQYRMNVASVFASLVLLAVLGIVFDRLILLAQRRVVFWSQRSDQALMG